MHHFADFREIDLFEYDIVKVLRLLLVQDKLEQPAALVDGEVADGVVRHLTTLK